MNTNKLGCRFLLVLLLASSLLACDAAHQKPRTLTVLHVNDVYRIEGVDAGSAGSIARLRTLRRQLQQQDPESLMLHAGDLLFPSSLSKQFNGAQMIDMLNRLDGDAQAFDARMFAVFGNHEFDTASLKSTDDPADILAKAVADSQFYWLGSNITFAEDSTGRSKFDAAHLINSHLREVNGIKVGIFGITTNINTPAYASIDADYVAVAKRMSKELREQGAEVIIALTHLSITQDAEILKSGDAGPDLILGGHEHDKQYREINGRYVIKADADARTASVTRITVDSSGSLDIKFHFEPLDVAVEQDPAILQRQRYWLRLYSQIYCHARNDTSDCLARPLGKTEVQLVAEESVIRRFETNLGNWLADLALDAFRQQGAQIAFINSGGLRLNQNIPAGAAITAQHLGQLFPYPTDLALLKINGTVLRQVIEHAIDDWTGSGRWLQIAGFAFVHNPEQQTASQLSLLTPAGPRQIEPDDELIAVVSGFLVDPGKGQDGYVFLSPRQAIPYEHGPIRLLDIVKTALADGAIHPRLEGRICNTSRPMPCLLDIKQ